MEKLDLEGFAKSFGVNSGELSKNVQNEIEKYNFNYDFFSNQEYKEIILEVLKKIDTDKQIIGDKSREKVWMDGWHENYIAYKNTGFSDEALVPKFVRKRNPVRLDQKFIKPFDDQFELNFVKVYRTWFLEKYFNNVDNIFEFGCGTGFNLIRASELFPTKNLFGSDFVQSSVDLVNTIASVKKINLKSELFNMLKPKNDYNIPKSSGVFTFGSFEQLASDFMPMIDFLIQKRPEICFHSEPMIELYEEDKNLEDYLAFKFQNKRGYSKGLISALKNLEKQKKIEIIKIKRLFFGSMFMEGYNMIAWKPL
jgi:SAM-dependent methyltransferase